MEFTSQDLTLRGEEFVRLVGVLGVADSRVLVFDAVERDHPEVPACILVLAGVDCGQAAQALAGSVKDPESQVQNIILLTQREADLRQAMLTAAQEINRNAGAPDSDPYAGLGR